MHGPGQGVCLQAMLSGLCWDQCLDVAPGRFVMHVHSCNFAVFGVTHIVPEAGALSFEAVTVLCNLVDAPWAGRHNALAAYVGG